LWGELVAVGGPVLSVPEDLGGAGASAVDTAIVAQELGRRIAPAPLVEAMVAAGLIVAAGGPDEVLAGIADGSILPAIALTPVTGEVARLVPAGAVADALVALRGDDLVLSRRPGARPHEPATANLASAPVADWALRADDVVLCRGEDARRRHRDAFAHGELLMAAALTGLGQAALAIATAYVKERQAFGVPLGWFQSIAHRLADVATAADGAELLMWEAAWARGDAVSIAGAASPVDTAGRAPVLARMALLFAAETAFDICRAGLQFHGGYGYTLEYDIQLYFRRAKAWPLAIGSPSVLCDRLGSALFGSGEH
jgi:alkylation response protein AidB-like acyl-CoA dehydrogenase